MQGQKEKSFAEEPILCEDLVVTSLWKPRVLNWDEQLDLAAKVLMDMATTNPETVPPLAELLSMFTTQISISKASMKFLLTHMAASMHSNMPMEFHLQEIVNHLLYRKVSYDLLSAYKQYAIQPLTFWGEFNKVASETEAELNDDVPRLSIYITQLMIMAAQHHRNTNCIPGTSTLQPDKSKKITRFITNEGLFFTRAPLSLEEYKTIMNRVDKLAATLPPNLHCVLASFAVLSDTGTLLNVTPHVECGPKPKIQGIVKSKASPIDPRYKKTEPDDTITVYPVVVNSIPKQTLPSPLTLDSGRTCDLTFNNIVTCSVGDTLIYSCVEICCDHGEGRPSFNSLVEEAVVRLLRGEQKVLGRHGLQTVVSNCLYYIFEQYCLVKTTQADPIWSGARGCHPGQEQQACMIEEHPRFGTPICMFQVQPYAVEYLDELELCKVDNYNALKSNFSKLSPVEVCSFFNESCIDPLTTVLYGTTLLMWAIQFNRLDYVQAMADVPHLDLRYCHFDLFAEKITSFFPKDSLPEVTSIDLRGNRLVTPEILKLLVASTPNLQSVDLTGCLCIPAEYAVSFQAQLSSAKTIRP